MLKQIINPCLYKPFNKSLIFIILFEDIQIHDFLPILTKNNYPLT